MLSASTTQPTQALKVLVIDDDDLDRSVMRRSFAALDEPIELIEVSDSRQAVEAITSNNPDITLLDLEMPHMDGFDVLMALQNKSAQTGLKRPVMMLSNSCLPTDRDKACELGALDYRTKPSTLSDYRRLAEDIHTTYITW